jgi:hypothetical protein
LFREAIPFRYRLLRPAEEREVIFLPKLSDEDVAEATSRLRGLGLAGPRLLRRGPTVIGFRLGSSSVRLMPRGLLLGPKGLFEMVAAELSFPLHHVERRPFRPCWTANGYLHTAKAGKDVVLHVRGRYLPPSSKFFSLASRCEGLLAPDELFMILAAVEAMRPSSIEVLLSKALGGEELSAPVKLGARGFLHHVRLSYGEFEGSADGIMSDAVSGECDLFPLPDSTVVLRDVMHPDPRPSLLSSARLALREWAADDVYFCREGFYI